MLESLVVLSLSLLGGTLMSTLANGVVVFMLYGVAFAGGWVEQIGSVLGSQTAVNIGIASSLLMPSEALWRYGVGLIQSNAGSLGTGLTPFSVASQPSNAFIVYSVLYVIALLAASTWCFSRRDF
jgi:Cu-processing system permease protein